MPRAPGRCVYPSLTSAQSAGTFCITVGATRQSCNGFRAGCGSGGFISVSHQILEASDRTLAGCALRMASLAVRSDALLPGTLSPSAHALSDTVAGGVRRRQLNSGRGEPINSPLLWGPADAGLRCLAGQFRAADPRR